MAIWAIADLHLSFGIEGKKMDVFGSQWIGYTEKIAKEWTSKIFPDDLVLLAGDFSWAAKSDEVCADFKWLSDLPGTKVMIKGNHDYWWASPTKNRTILPRDCHLIQNNSFNWHDVVIAGTRLWDVPHLDFRSVIDFKENSQARVLTAGDKTAEDAKIYLRELNRLEISLKSMNPQAKTRLVMTHYPPIGLNFEETEVSRLLEKYQVSTCVFGHLHSIKPGLKLFGEHNGVKYVLTACDYLKDFSPIRIM